MPPASPPPTYPPSIPGILVELTSGATYQFGGVPIKITGAGVSVIIRPTGATPAILDAEHLSRHFIVENGAKLTLYNLVIKNGFAGGTDDAGSVHVSGTGSALRLFGTTMLDNAIGQVGFFNSRGGGIFAMDDSLVNATGCHFENNTAAYGGSICVTASALYATECTFLRDFAPRGGSIGLQSDSPTPGVVRPGYGYVLNCHVRESSSTFFGGAIYPINSDLHVVGGTCVDCTQTVFSESFGGGAIIGVGGVVWPVASCRIWLTDVLFERCIAAGTGGGFYTVDFSQVAENFMSAFITRCRFVDCVGDTGGGAGLWKGHNEIIDCTFENCEALTAGGGGLLLKGTKDDYPTIIRGTTFVNCSTGEKGGGLFFSKLAKAIVETSDFTDCVADSHGGAVSSSLGEEAHLTTHNVNFLRCHATGSDAGAVSFTGILTLIDTNAIECTGRYNGGYAFEQPSTVHMLRCSIIRCSSMVNEASIAGALRFYGGSLTMDDTDVVDCYSFANSAIVISGEFVMRNSRVRRLGSYDISAWAGAISVVGGSSLIENTLIEGSTPGGPPTIVPEHGCLQVLGGTVTLRNVSMARCHTNAMTSGAYVHVGRAGQLVGAHVDAVTNCTGATQPLFEAYGRPLALRHLRVLSADGCALPPPAQLVGNSTTTIATCNQLSAANGACGTEATCTDVPIFPSVASASSLTTAQCSCTGSAFARATAELSAELLPYSFGCFTQREATSLSVAGARASSVIFRLTKSATADETAQFVLQIAMEGTDTEAGADWSVGNAPSWLTVPQTVGRVNKTESLAAFEILASTANMPGRKDPYTEVLNVSVVSGKNSAFPTPVFLFVTATTVAATWGLVDPSTSLCATSVVPEASTRIFAGATLRVPFVGCDREGLKNARRLPSTVAGAVDTRSFTASLRWDTARLPLDVTYDEVTGDYSASFTAQREGIYFLTLQLGGEAVATELRIAARCAVGQISLSDGTCACSAGSIPNADAGAVNPCVSCSFPFYAFPGDTTCKHCQEEYYFDGATCLRCPVESTTCAAGSTMATLQLAQGYYRTTNRTMDIRRCQFHDQPSKTPCLGGAVSDADSSLWCDGEGNQRGPLCRICDEPGLNDVLGYYYQEETGRCTQCPVPSEGIGGIVGVILGIVVAVALLAWVYYQPPSALEGFSAGMHVVTRFLEPLGLWPKFKQLIAFFQVLFSLGTVYRTSLPKEFSDAFSWLTWMTFDVFDLYPPACIGTFSSRLLFTGIVPLGIIAGTLVVTSAAGAAFGAATNGRLRESTYTGFAVGSAVSVIVLWVLTPAVSKASFESFDCESYRTDDATGEAKMYLNADYRLTCDSAAYDGLVGTAGAFIAIWTAGVPILFGAMLYGAQKGDKKGGLSQLLSRATTPLSREYEPLSYYWEVIELVRRLVVSAIVLAMPSSQSTLRLAPALVTCFLYLILLFTVKPFRRADDLIVAASANIMLVFVFVTCFFIKTFDDIAAVNVDFAGSVLGVSSSFQAAILIIVMGFIQVAVVAFAIIDKMRRSLQALRLKKLNADKARVQRAIESCQQLRHPAVFVTFEDLRKQGKFPAHEEARQAGLLHVIDTHEQLIDFTSKETTLFVSHQWLSFSAPDPDSVQYTALCEACDALCNLKGLSASKLYVWLDYASIPQANISLKQLAIDTLALYSSACRYFLVLAPDAVHTDTLKKCDLDSYSSRGWCRLEQWANATSGFTGMFIFGSGRKLEPLASADAVRDAVFVFEGQFTVDADKLKIVDTVLGLYSICLQGKGELLERISEAPTRTFPKDYFGELPGLLVETMNGQPAAPTGRKLVKRKSTTTTMPAAPPPESPRAQVEVEVI